ncbi:uncharacterized protein LOC143430130 [Xylocopa sonorina]|uniref:uncharacterized protein LOC143430130 n=1 Tax=Xylocopa sonorina TaxID=1818115 RepID=UPI00403B107D
MAQPKEKAKDLSRKGRLLRAHHFRRRNRKRSDVPRRSQTRRPTAAREMVYRLFCDHKHNQKRRQSRGYGGGGGASEKIRRYQASSDSSSLRDSSPSIEESKYTKSAATSVENLSRVMDAANSSGASSSENSSVSNVSVEPIARVESIDNTRVLLKKKSLVQVINNYIKAGIEEGKRQAKKYIRKALSFGVKSGYLIPADPKGQVIRISPTLIGARRGNAELRKRRRKARRGENEPYTSGRERRRSTPLWNTKKTPRREDTPKPETPPRKRRKTSDSKIPESNQKRRKTARKKPLERSKRSKKRTTGRRKGLVITRRARSSHKIAEKQKADEQREEDRRNRRTKSSRARKEDGGNCREECRDSSNEDEDSVKFSGNEVNERIPLGRRKSATSREDAPRNSSVPPGNPAREVEECLETANRVNGDDDTTGNVN